MLKINNLSTHIQTDAQNWFKAVNDVSFSIESGEVFALIGESGSGKSMTALSIMRLLPPKARYTNASEILLHGKNILNLPEKQMREIRGYDIGMIFQDPMTSLNPVLTIGEQIGEVLTLHRNLKDRERYVETLRLLDAMRIPDAMRRYNSYPHELSGGMKQRVMIAIALACKPSLLIADEPTTALDVTTQAQILNLLQELQQQENMAMLLITHDMAVAAQMADKVAVMQSGHLVEQDSSAKFFCAPQHAYSQKLLASLPSLYNLQPHIAKANAPAILQVKDLRVHFPIKAGFFRKTVGYVKAVNNISFALTEGETLAIVGESGCGKTSVAKALMGLIDEAKGEVIFEHNNILNMQAKQFRSIRENLQIIFQDPYSALNPKLRILDSLAEGLLAQDKFTKLNDCIPLIDQLLNQVGLIPEHKWRYPHELSGGERQRVCIARALSISPKIIICDEPTSSLDVSVQSQVLNLLQKLQQDQNLTYLFISHDLTVISLLAHKVAVMYRGEIVECGLVQDVLGNPQHEYTRELLAAIPKMEHALRE